MRRVVGRHFPSEVVRLEGYARFRVSGELYPGIVGCPGEQTVGLLYRHVDGRSLVLLDRFEGPLYVRRAVTVMRANGTVCRAQAYVVPGHRRDRLSAERWDLQRFEALHLRSFLSTAGLLPKVLGRRPAGPLRARTGHAGRLCRGGNGSSGPR